MKQLLNIFLAAAMFVTLAANALAQGNPRGTAKFSLNGTTVAVEYGRPSLKGRTADDLFNELKPGDVWRFGADKSTTLTTTGDLVFGDVTVPKGEYSLWVRREADNKWSLIVNKQHGQWGVSNGGKANRDASKDVAVVPLTVESEKTSDDKVTVEFEKEGGGGEITIQWGNTELSALFKTK